MIRGDRRQRHLKILELISTHAIRTQEELADALAREGWDVTQSSVSRDITALKLIKIDGVYTRPAVARVARRDPDEQRIVEGAGVFSGRRFAGCASHPAGRGEPGRGGARSAGLARDPRQHLGR